MLNLARTWCVLGAYLAERVLFFFVILHRQINYIQMSLGQIIGLGLLGYVLFDNKNMKDLDSSIKKIIDEQKKAIDNDLQVLDDKIEEAQGKPETELEIIPEVHFYYHQYYSAIYLKFINNSERYTYHIGDFKIVNMSVLSYTANTFQPFYKTAFDILPGESREILIWSRAFDTNLGLMMLGSSGKYASVNHIFVGDLYNQFIAYLQDKINNQPNTYTSLYEGNNKAPTGFLFKDAFVIRDFEMEVMDGTYQKSTVKINNIKGNAFVYGSFYDGKFLNSSIYKNEIFHKDKWEIMSLAQIGENVWNG